ncbi:MAG: PKD domain-containing protein [Nitrospirota bacterium]
MVVFLYGTDMYACSDAVTLSWMPPTKNADGTPLQDIYGYKLYYGYGPRNYAYVIDVGNNTSYTLCGLIRGTTYFFAVTAYDISRNESNYSSEISKLIAPLPDVPAVDFTGRMSGSTAPLTVNFTSSTTGGNSPFSYAWDFDNSGGAADSTQQYPSYTYKNWATGGVYPPYTVKLTVTDSDGDIGTITKTGYVSVCYSNTNIVGSTGTYTSLQAAYNAAGNGKMVQGRAVSITGNVDFNLPKTIIINGGYNCNHSSIAGKTVIKGSMIISNGKVTIENVNIQ